MKAGGGRGGRGGGGGGGAGAGAGAGGGGVAQKRRSVGQSRAGVGGGGGVGGVGVPGSSGSGFTFGTGYYFKKYLGKAKDWGRPGGFIRPPSKGLANRHSWIKERECLLKLSEELPNSVIVHESAQKGGRGGGFAHSTKGRRLLLNDTATMH